LAVTRLGEFIADKGGTHMTIDAEKIKAGVLFIGGLMEALGTPQLSHKALGIWVRIADDDNHCLSARAIAERSPVEDEKAVLDALHELERAGLVRLERVQEPDDTFITYARVDFRPEESMSTRKISER
jgi:hypothetical protein